MQNSKSNLHFPQSRRSKVTHTFAVAVPCWKASANRLLSTKLYAKLLIFFPVSRESAYKSPFRLPHGTSAKLFAKYSLVCVCVCVVVCAVCVLATF